MMELQQGVLPEPVVESADMLRDFLAFMAAASTDKGRKEIDKLVAAMLKASADNQALLDEAKAVHAEVEEQRAEQSRQIKALEAERFDLDKAAAKVAEDRATAEKRIEEAAGRESAVTAREQQFAKDRKQFDSERDRFRAARDAVLA